MMRLDLWRDVTVYMFFNKKVLIFSHFFFEQILMVKVRVRIRVKFEVKVRVRVKVPISNRLCRSMLVVNDRIAMPPRFTRFPP